MPARPAEVRLPASNREDDRYPAQDQVPSVVTSSPPVVHVTIGRLEVRATVAEVNRPEPTRTRGVMSLDDYVAQRRSAR